MQKLIQLPQTTKLLENTVVANEYLVEGTLLGIAYIKVQDEMGMTMLVATPLGGFIQHAERPNCILQTVNNYWSLWAINDIRIHEEITLNFNHYGLQ